MYKTLAVVLMYQSLDDGSTALHYATKHGQIVSTYGVRVQQPLTLIYDRYGAESNFR